MNTLAELRPEQRRDLELLLIGYVMCQSDDRKRVMDTFPVGSLGIECDKLMKSIRNQDATDLQQWLAERRAPLVNGIKPIDSVINCLLNANKKQEVRNICLTLVNSAKMDDVESIKRRLKQALERLELLQ